MDAFTKKYESADKKLGVYQENLFAMIDKVQEQCEDLIEYMEDEDRRNKERAQRVENQILYQIKNILPLKEQVSLLEEVKKWQIDPPANIPLEKLRMYQRIDWPIIERVLSQQLLPENRKEPPKRITRQKIRSKIERDLPLCEEEGLLEFVQAQIEGKEPIGEDDWWRTVEDLEIIKEELEANLKLKIPLQAPRDVRIAYWMDWIEETFLPRFPLAFQRVLEQRICHFIESKGEDACGAIAFIKQTLFLTEEKRMRATSTALS